MGQRHHQQPRFLRLSSLHLRCPSLPNSQAGSYHGHKMLPQPQASHTGMTMSGRGRGCLFLCAYFSKKAWFSSHLTEQTVTYPLLNCQQEKLDDALEWSGFATDLKRGSLSEGQVPE